jgi:hypothetical protein
MEKKGKKILKPYKETKEIKKLELDYYNLFNYLVTSMIIAVTLILNLDRIIMSTDNFTSIGILGGFFLIILVLLGMTINKNRVLEKAIDEANP